MPKVEDRFSGHFETGDPRGPLTAAGGCDWPTVPAFRYWLKSDDATLDLRFLNSHPVLLEFSSVQPAHDVAAWSLVPPHDFVSVAAAVKVYFFPNNTYAWTFAVLVNAIPEEPLLFNVIRDSENCNRDIPLPNVFAFDIDRGVTGDTFRMEQIEFDKTAPPS